MTIDQTATIVLPVASADTVRQIVQTLGADETYITLSEGKAFEFVFSGTAEALNVSLSQMNISADVCVQPTQGRKKSLLICDMDSTLIGQECIDELADFAGVKEHVSGITERAMRGELDFEEALTERVALLKNLDLSVLETCFEERIKLNPGAVTLCQTMKANGAKTVIVSGGFTFFTERVAKACGFESHHANTLLDDGDSLIGDVGRPILGREAKQQTLEKYSDNLGGPTAAIAIGDGANDLAMIQAAGLGVAYYAKPAVAAAAHCAINHTDLTTALYFQGYKDSEFVEG
ncbi:MAG: phosphoserine phosphatase SerB [Litorimonas sp.]